MHRTNALRSRTSSLGLALLLAAAATANAAPTPEEACEGGKNQAAGKYAACIAKAEKALVTKGDMAKYSAALAKCEGKLAVTWGKLEFAAIAAGTTCPTTGDRPPIGNFLDACGASIAEAVSGGTLPVDVVTCHEDLEACEVDEAACDGDLAACEGTLATATGDLADCDADVAFCEGLPFERVAATGQSTCYANNGDPLSCAGTGQDGELMAGAVRNDVDNGDGTITDKLTGLMWEKLSNDGSIHDKDNQYTGLAAAIGKTTTLNGMAFAGYTDWRIPNRRELESLIVLGNYNPALPSIFNESCPESCTVLTCSCDRRSVYWSSTTYRLALFAVYVINTTDGDVYAVDRATSIYYARAVRSVY